MTRYFQCLDPRRSASRDEGTSGEIRPAVVLKLALFGQEFFSALALLFLSFLSSCLHQLPHLRDEDPLEEPRTLASRRFFRPLPHAPHYETPYYAGTPTPNDFEIPSTRSSRKFDAASASCRPRPRRHPPRRNPRPHRPTLSRRSRSPREAVAGTPSRHDLPNLLPPRRPSRGARPRR